MQVYLDALCEKCVFGIILVRIFPHLDWIWRDTPYLSIFSTNAGKQEPENFRIRTLFTLAKVVLENICLHCTGLFAFCIMLFLGKIRKQQVQRLYFRNLYCDPKRAYMLTLNLTLKSRDLYDGVCDIHYLLFERRTFVKKNKKSYFW